jgi:NTE family protein
MYKLAFCFSGGGVRGVAHLGILKAFNEAGLRAEAVSGASAGAVVAAFYAGGHSPEETFEFLKHMPFYTSWGHYTYNKPGVLDTENFYKYFEPYFPENKFEALKIPCFISCTDLITAKEEIFSTGELIYRTLASCAFPFVFAPVKMDGSLYSDGGIANNFPIEPLESSADYLVGIYVNPLEKMTLDSFSNSWRVSERAVVIRSYTQSKPKFDRCHTLIMPEELKQFNIFDKRHIDKIFSIGYEYGQRFAPQVHKALEGTKASREIKYSD